MAGTVLIYGTGVIGSVYALRFAKAGLSVTAVARGDRLASLRKAGIVARHALLGAEERVDVTVEERPPKGAAYDLILVALRSGQVDAGLRDLAEAGVAGPVLVVGNNLGDLGAQASIVGPERLILGFGMIGGYRDGDAIVYLDGRSPDKPELASLGRTTVGVIDERAGPALSQATGLLAGAGLPTTESPDIAAYLVYHAALVFPLAASMYAAGGDQARYCRTRDAIVLGVRACKELFKALGELGVSLQPASLRPLVRAPEWLLAPLLAKRLAGESARVAMFGHAGAPGGREEIGGQAALLDATVRRAGLPLPAWDRILPYMDRENAPAPLPDGSRALRLRLL